MDPLSITAAGFAFAGAINQVAKCIQRLRAIRQAPLEIQLLLEEVLDLSGLLNQLDPTQSQSFTSFTGSPAEKTVSAGAGLEWQIARTSSKLQELDSLLQEHTHTHTHTHTTSKSALFGIHHLGWPKGRQRANALRRDLKVLRLNLTASLGANTSLVATTPPTLLFDSLAQISPLLDGCDYKESVLTISLSEYKLTASSRLSSGSTPDKTKPQDCSQP